MAVPFLVTSVLVLVPAFVVLFLAYGPYDGVFRDQTLFLQFMFGLGLGLLLAVAQAFLLLGVAAPFVFVLLVPWLESLAKVAVLNRRSLAGQRTTIFYGGSLGLGVGVMVALGRATREVTDLDLGFLAAEFAIAGGLVLVHFATGVLAGFGVYQGRRLAWIAAQALVLLPLYAFLVEYAGTSAVIYLGLIVAYGLAASFFVVARFFPQGMDAETARQRRRRFLRSFRRAE
ncbi:MAG: hypothetical protein ACT4PT_00535 [Methanobacteriota archaeon]